NSFHSFQINSISGDFRCLYIFIIKLIKFCYLTLSTVYPVQSITFGTLNSFFGLSSGSGNYFIKAGKSLINKLFFFLLCLINPIKRWLYRLRGVNVLQYYLLYFNPVLIIIT